MKPPTKYSPGPWTAVPKDAKTINILCIEDLGPWMRLAEVSQHSYVDGTGTHQIDHDKTLANARLIAAAPGMIEALIEIQERMKAFKPGHDLGVSALCEKIILKALGEE